MAAAGLVGASATWVGAVVACRVGARVSVGVGVWGSAVGAAVVATAAVSKASAVV